MGITERPPLGARRAAAVLAIGALLGALALGAAALREPVGDAANILFFPRLRWAVFLYVAALGAVGVLCLLAAIAGLRALLLLSAASAAALAVASVVLAYFAHAVGARLEPQLLEECGRLRGGGRGSGDGLGGDDVAFFVDLSLGELAHAFAACRAGAYPDALTLNDCPQLADLVDVSGERNKYFIRLERAFEARLGCTGLCRSLATGPLFTGPGTRLLPSGLPTGSSLPPACWRPFAAAVALAGERLGFWLGLLNAPALLAAALAVACPLASYIPSGVAASSGYERVPTDSVMLEVAASPTWQNPRDAPEE